MAERLALVFILFIFFFSKIYFSWSTMPISAVWQSNLVIHIYTFFSIMIYHGILNIVPRAVP